MRDRIYSPSIFQINAEHLPEMTNSSSSDQGQDDVIVLLTLEPIHSCDLTGPSDQWVATTTLSYHISQQVFLTVVCGQDGDLISRVTQQSHVHEQRDTVLSFSQILVEVRVGFRLTDSLLFLEE